MTVAILYSVTSISKLQINQDIINAYLYQKGFAERSNFLCMTSSILNKKDR